VTVIRLATRGSNLALWQARHVAGLLRRQHHGLSVRLVIVNSSGDTDHATPLYRMGNNVGVFCKEVQQAVLEGKADAGVHSMKDLPTSEPDGLAVAAVLERADARDVLVGALSLASLPQGALVGTSSLRRQAQLAHARPDLRFTSIRGNVETRLRKVREQDGGVVATIMAYAGLKRLGLLRRADAAPLDPWTTCTPAPAQGAVAVDCRAGDHRTRWLLTGMHHRDTATAVGIERMVLAGLAGGCSLPLGCYARRQAGRWEVRVRLGRERGLLELIEQGASSVLPELVLRRLRD
jgi:hydroxymethylbilane synthase